jgi:hypothetical protein
MFLSSSSSLARGIVGSPSSPNDHVVHGPRVLKKTLEYRKTFTSMSKQINE